MNWFCSPLLKPLAQPNVKNETMRRNDWFSNESIQSFHIGSFTKYSTKAPINITNSMTYPCLNSICNIPNIHTCDDP